MSKSPPGSWPDPLSLDPKSLPRNVRPQPLQPGKEWKPKRKEVAKNKPQEKATRALELPPEILEQILYLTDPETFASLVLVNHAWRAASQTPHLYAHHLSRCPSYSITNNFITGPFTENSLPQLKQQFVREVKRNLFEAYLRPRQTIVSLTSTTTSSSASFPGGEAFEFAFSPNGEWTLALSSSRIYVLDTVSPKVSVKRELKVLRRPVSAAILNDGSILAVLSRDRKANVYNLSDGSVKHVRAVDLDNRPHTIALSPKGEVLAAAYDGGIELHSLAPSALATDQRWVKCDFVDSLAFSKDGTMLLGTTHHSSNPNTVVLSAPFYDESTQELPASDVLSHMWTSQILFPNSSRDCSHAALLPDHAEGDATWTCTYDRVFESFRAVRTDDLRNGTTYFTGPKRRRRTNSNNRKSKLTPCTLPAATDQGDLVAAGFLGKDIWLYGIPEGLDAVNVSHGDESANSTRPNSASSSGRNPAISHTRGESAELRRLPQWQVLVDKHRNVLVKGRKVTAVPGVTGVKWVGRKDSEKDSASRSRSVAERLLVSAPGGVSGPSDIDIEHDDFASVDGGRLIILDFDRGIGDGRIEHVHFEIGHAKPEFLEEKDMDIEAEVDIMRRRTTRQRLGAGLGTSVADALASAPELPIQAATTTTVSLTPLTAASADDPLVPRTTGRGRVPASPVEGLSLEEASQVFDGPYSHTQPRSRTSLHRSATAVAANRQRNPPRPLGTAAGQVQYRRPDGRGELPHESDADNWVPPPPMYTPKPERPLPDYLRQVLMPVSESPRRRGSGSRSAERPRRASTMYEGLSSASSTRRIVSSPERANNPLQRSDTVSTLHSGYPSTRDHQPAGNEPISPTSTMGFVFPSTASEASSSSPHTSPSTPSRRPVSAFVGRFRSGHQKSLTARLTSPISPIPLSEADERRLSGSSRSVSLPSSPVWGSFQPSRQTHRLTLSGANLQSRLEYPLPPAPKDGESGTTTRPHTSYGGGGPNFANDVPAVPDLPSAEQLANLHNRYCHSPTQPDNRAMPPAVRTSMDHANARPPRAALGAAGSPISPLTESRRSSIAQRNSFAASSPALLRPTAQRLDTIQSISSVLSQARSRSRSREGDTGARRLRRRSRSAGPGFPGKASEGKRKWFGGKKSKASKNEAPTAPPAGAAPAGGGGGSAYLENSRMLNERYRAETAAEREKGGKCVVM
ncbi:MAG: hypothetical protein LQ346_007129 [Caloplaca aetnensis]|nr:MAG: hypothetical protein LQ346_007129 [Caloplaca aetnensis]